MKHANDGTRSLLESIMAQEVAFALNEWKAHAGECVLIGSIALSYWCKPRHTDGIDLLYRNSSAIPNIAMDFYEPHKTGFIHKETGVAINIHHPVNLPVHQGLIECIFESAVTCDGQKIASKESLIALKLYRYGLQDQADIEQLTALFDQDVDLSLFGIEGVGLMNLQHWNSCNNRLLKG